MMAAREVRVVLQPILDLRNGAVLAHEALVRSAGEHPIGPREMFEAAVRSGCCGAFGRAIREAAVTTAPDLPLFLNVHPCELTEPWLLAQDDPIYQHEPPVYLEITESVPLSQLAKCRVLLHRLRRRGVHVVVDDLGAGYSNLRYLAELQPRLVKLDRALISGLRAGTRMFRLVAGLVVLCESLDAEVVAEGIEMMAELAAVQEAGVQYGQGYLFARPDYPAPPPHWPVQATSTEPASAERRLAEPESHVRRRPTAPAKSVAGDTLS